MTVWHGTHLRGNPRTDRLWVRLAEVARLVGVPVLLAAVITASAPGWTTYRIKHGDTVSEIAARYRVSVAQIVEINRLPGNGSLIYAGAVLKVPRITSAGRGATGRARAPRATTRTVLIKHRVVRGDALSGIARRYGVPAARIQAANHLPNTIVRLGATLRIPVITRVSPPRAAPAKAKPGQGTGFGGRVYPAAVVSAAARNRAALAARSHPSRARTRGMIMRTARAMGVDPELALAVAWNESGWNQRRVSAANAIGVMQVLPSTGRWVSGKVGRDLNLLRAGDNILAGVALLKVLTHAAPLNNAVAGYYQGLGSVRRNGMYQDTERYVATVLSLKQRFERS